MHKELQAIQTHSLDFWLARASVGTIAILQLLVVNRLSLGPPWLAPTVELSLLLPLSVATVRTQKNILNAREQHHWQHIEMQQGWIRRVSLALTAIVTALNAASLLNVVRALVAHGAPKTGETILLDAINIWITNVIIFGLWYWTIDRGGPASRHAGAPAECDFLFPQMAMHHDKAPLKWSPGFIDYLFVAFTNASAFSPTDTMPLTERAKLLMMFQSATSLLTLALVAARAVNILN